MGHVHGPRGRGDGKGLAGGVGRQLHLCALARRAALELQQLVALLLMLLLMMMLLQLLLLLLELELELLWLEMEAVVVLLLMLLLDVMVRQMKMRRQLLLSLEVVMGLLRRMRRRGDLVRKRSATVSAAASRAS